MSSNVAGNMISAGLDQDYAMWVDHWEELTPLQRGEIGAWLAERKGDLREAPDWILKNIASLASVAYLEVGLRWAELHKGG